MSEIHPTAVIDPGAELAEDVTIGPYAVINAGVQLGSGCVVHSHAVLSGPAQIGERNVFYPHACVGGQTQDLKYAGEPTYLEIGDDNVFREFVTVNRSDKADELTRIGSHGNFLAYSHIAHDCQVGDHVIFSNNGTLAGHVTVGDYVILGGLTAVHQFCRLGDHAITGGCSKIVQDIAPFMIADGNPAEIRGINKVGLERRGVSKESIRAISETHKILFRSGKNTTQAVEELQGRTDLCQFEQVAALIDFVGNSERGIIR